MMVLISTSDNEQFSVDRDVAERSLLIKQLIEDIGESDQAIPLPNVSSSVLTKVLEYCSHHRNDPLSVADEPDEIRRRATDISEWDARFIQVDQEMLFEIILAANYLDIKSLLDIGCKTVYVCYANRQSEYDQGQAARGNSQAVQYPERLYPRGRGSDPPRERMLMPTDSRNGLRIASVNRANGCPVAHTAWVATWPVQADTLWNYA